jgi:chemotaxis protein MotB
MSRKPVMARRLRRHEEHTNHEAWAIPYADLLTLLLAFFVVMYAISSVNAGKYRVLSDSLFAAFRGTPRTMEPIQVGEKQAGSGSELESAVIQSQLQGQQRSSLAPVPVEGGFQANGTSSIANRLPPKALAPGIAGTQAAGAAGAAAAALARVADEVARALDDLVKQNLVVMRRTELWIEVEIKTDILFPSGSAHLAPYAVDVIDRLAGALAPFPNPIRVEGHTDNKPINTVAFYSNWELSAARAGSVVHVLQARGVGADRLAVIGYGEQRPVQSNDTEQGRNANRRVVVVILSTELQRRQDPADQPGTVTPIPPSTGAPAAAAPGNIAALELSPAPATSNPTPASAAPSLALAATAAPTASAPSAPQATLATPGEPAELPTAHAAAPASVTLSTSGTHAAGMAWFLHPE